MPGGKPLIMALGMALFLCSRLWAGDGGADEYYTPGLLSLRRNAVVTIGGEIRVDFSRRVSESKTRPGIPRYDARFADLSLRQANLRLLAHVHPNVKAHFKLNLGADPEHHRDRDQIMEEAMLVVGATRIPGLGAFAGKGRAPYGQDITLGMVQSYAHTANHGETGEGPIFIIEPPRDVVPDPRNPDAEIALSPMRPGQFDRAFMAGVSYEWSPRWRVELAAFQPNRHEYEPRLRRSGDVEARGGASVGGAGRIWWSPLEELVLQASAMLARSSAMGRAEKRVDLAPGARTTKNARAFSAGFDWRREPWRVFGEYQRGWDWNFGKGYNTQSWQVGMARNFGTGWRLGGMVEGLRIRNGQAKTVDAYYKLVLNIRYEFSAGLFVLAEYGHEWLRRERTGELYEKRRGDFVGMRIGFTF